MGLTHEGIESMRALPAALAALLITAPLVLAPGTAAAVDPVQVRSVGHPGLSLSALEHAVPVEAEPRRGGPDQQWRVHYTGLDNMAITNWHARGCLTAYEPGEVLVLECIGTPSQSWIDFRAGDGSSALGNVAHPGLCLTVVRPLRPVAMAPCDPDDRDQFWRWRSE